MKYGIIFAMEEELRELKKYLIIKKEYTIFDLHFYEGTIYDKHCLLVQCGVGKVNAARTTQLLIDNFKVDFIFNIGVAGGVDQRLSVGDIVIGEKMVQHDFDITAFNHEKGYIPEIGQPFILADEYLIRKAKETFNEDNVFVGTIASGDIFCTDVNMSMKINKKFNALCTEMEGASIAQVCYLCYIPFLIIRSISDVVNNENTTTYEEFLEASSKIVANKMALLLKNLD